MFSDQWTKILNDINLLSFWTLKLIDSNLQPKTFNLKPL